ncbi:efflux RND transporter periplasmic adaptor subunit [Desulfogranum mediterraneum]|uniref:efflux RND transporter periplasmic adaptor subunit n=1 Tax=Desulfogranum mediterraneum TaxID=160661 RepID=UPI0003FEF047|nr:efflux RND transporter periplasmic adaptor subunit [Desulfogranum mediterraneum]
MHVDTMVSKPLGRAMALLLAAASLVLASAERPAQAAPPSQPREVVVLSVQPRPLTLTTELPGRTSAFRVAEIRPQVSGLILRRLFEEGSDVESGQLLYQLDPAPFQAMLDTAQASLLRAEANLSAIRSRVDRYQKLLADKAVSRQDYDDAAAVLKQTQAEIASWKAQVKTARINLQYTQVTAPISGRIGRSRVTEGAIVTAYQPLALATIQQLDPIYVDVPQSTSELLRLKRSLADGRLDQGGTELNRVNLVLEDGLPYSQEGSLQFQDVTVDPTTGSVILRLVFPNPDGLLLPGMFVQALIKEGISRQAILVPQQGVSRDPKGNPFAMIVDPEGKVLVRRLTIDRAIKDQWFVTSGLVAGDRLIIEGRQMLRPGTVVKAVPSAGKGSEQGLASAHAAQSSQAASAAN